MYAIVADGGRQIRVEPGKEVLLDYKGKLSPGDEVLLDNVLFYKGKEPVFGAPYIESVKVKGVVKEHVKGKKIVVFRFKRRKNVRVKKGFRPRFTKVQIQEIQEIQGGSDGT